ncbi:MAG: hypothetical protein JWO08_571 [Verrucomicrobiaceae bacterium]|nr:hypothetical protein [Verrucomicrobiaceae bacterium]
MEIQTVCTLQDFLALEPDWERLWHRQKTRQVFQHHAWARAFIESFCQPGKWLVQVAREQGEVVALLPLWEDSKQGVWRFIGSPNSDYQYLLGDENVIAGMIPTLASAGVQALRFEAMPEGPTLWKALWARGHAVVQSRGPLPCRYMALTQANVTAYLLKKGLKDNERRLSKLGPLHLRVIAPGEERMQALEILFEQHRQKWSCDSRPSQFDDPRTCDFYRRVCSAPELAAMLHFSVLEAGERILACHVGFVHGECFIYYKPTYDPAQKGAGRVMMGRLMEAARSMGLQEFDFTRGDEPYKIELATGTRDNHEAHLFFSTKARLKFQAGQWLRHRVPRDSEGLALTTKLVRWMRGK